MTTPNEEEQVRTFVLTKQASALLLHIMESEEIARALLARMANCGCEQAVSADETCLDTGEPEDLWCWPCQAHHFLETHQEEPKDPRVALRCDRCGEPVSDFHETVADQERLTEAEVGDEDEEGCLSPDEEVIREIGSRLDKAEATLRNIADAGCQSSLSPKLGCSRGGVPKHHWCAPCVARAHMEEVERLEELER